MRKGFTLLEVIIYTALLSILIIGLFGSVFSVIDNHKWFSQRTFAFQEGNFALKKILWYLQTSEEIILPEIMSSSTILFLRKDGEDVKIYLENGSIIISKIQATSTLTSKSVKPHDLFFDRTYVGSLNLEAKSLKIDFSIEGVDFEKTIWFQ